MGWVRECIDFWTPEVATRGNAKLAGQRARAVVNDFLDGRISGEDAYVRGRCASFDLAIMRRLPNPSGRVSRLVNHASEIGLSQFFPRSGEVACAAEFGVPGFVKILAEEYPLACRLFVTARETNGRLVTLHTGEGEDAGGKPWEILVQVRVLQRPGGGDNDPALIQVSFPEKGGKVLGKHLSGSPFEGRRKSESLFVVPRLADLGSGRELLAGGELPTSNEGVANRVRNFLEMVNRVSILQIHEYTTPLGIVIEPHWELEHRPANLRLSERTVTLGCRTWEIAKDRDGAEGWNEVGRYLGWAATVADAAISRIFGEKDKEPSPSPVSPLKEGAIGGARMATVVAGAMTFPAMLMWGIVKLIDPSLPWLAAVLATEAMAACNGAVLGAVPNFMYAREKKIPTSQPRAGVSGAEGGTPGSTMLESVPFEIGNAAPSVVAVTSPH